MWLYAGGVFTRKDCILHTIFLLHTVLLSQTILLSQNKNFGTVLLNETMNMLYTVVHLIPTYSRYVIGDLDS